MSDTNSASSAVHVSDAISKVEKKENLVLKLEQLELSVKVKELENSLYQLCMKECLNFNEDGLAEREKNCLENCNAKLMKFREVFKNTYQYQ